MDGTQFDALVQSLTHSRRAIFGGGLALVSGWLGAQATTAKKKRRKHKKRQPIAKPNAYGCFEVNDPCSSDDQCCSGVCEGKQCRAHGTGTCPQGVGSLCDANPTINACNNNDRCVCVATTAGSNYCASNNADDLTCAECQTDADCDALGYPAGSACAPFDTGQCAGLCASGTTCLIPCGVVIEI